MPLLSVNMAVPVKEHIRESQIYFLSSAESVPPQNQTLDRKYLFFKVLELILSLCFLMLFAYSMQAKEDVVEDMIKYLILGGLTVYPLLFILLAISVEVRPVFSIITNSSAVIALLVIGATTMLSSWTKAQILEPTADKEIYFRTLIHLRSSFLITVTGMLYLIESLIMCIEVIRKFCLNNN